MPRSRMLELYLHASTGLHDVVKRRDHFTLLYATKAYIFNVRQSQAVVLKQADHNYLLKH
jgi:hypothetical protein